MSVQLQLLFLFQFTRQLSNDTCHSVILVKTRVQRCYKRYFIVVVTSFLPAKTKQCNNGIKIILLFHWIHEKESCHMSLTIGDWRPVTKSVIASYSFRLFIYKLSIARAEIQYVSAKKETITYFSYLQENMELRFDYEQARKENPRLKVKKRTAVTI